MKTRSQSHNAQQLVQIFENVHESDDDELSDEDANIDDLCCEEQEDSEYEENVESNS